MDLAAAGLNEQPFRTHGKPLVVVPYASQREALKTLKETCTALHGLCLLQGPALSGKSTLIRRFLEQLPDECSVAFIDGNGLNTAGMLEAVLRQFGYVLDHSSTGELLAMLRVFALQQAASQEAPILIIENAHALNPSALRALCELADLKLRGRSALKMVLVSDRSLTPITAAPEMERIHKRVTHDFHMHPMTNIEAMEYLHTKLEAAGSEVPEAVLPISVCTELWRASGGWPGIIDRIALLALAKSEALPVSMDQVEKPVIPQGTWAEVSVVESQQMVGPPPGPPTLYVSLDGSTIQELTFDKPRLLIGRSEHNDIPIASKFISRHHALLVRNGNTTFLMDLNSTNGTFVNSRRISNHVLIDDDVISIGNHRIKFADPFATRRNLLDGVDFADTAIMKSLEDMRSLLARENTAIMPIQAEEHPKSG